MLATLLAENHIDLDFLAICSSMSAIAPIMGQVDYGAANAFLDAFAASAGHRTRTVSINWGFWQELGMIESKAKMAERLKTEILNEIAQRMGKAGVRRSSCILANCTTTQVVVTPENLTLDLGQRYRSTGGGRRGNENRPDPTSDGWCRL